MLLRKFKRLIPIIKTIILCGRSNLPLRGHREEGDMKDLDIKQSALKGDQGVFRALLAFRMDAGDADLKRHFEISGKTGRLISPRIQNEIMEVKSSIIEKVNTSKYYSILCDETTDISKKKNK